MSLIIRDNCPLYDKHSVLLFHILPINLVSIIIKVDCSYGKDLLMTTDNNLLKIMENAISSLKTNKDTLMEIIQDLQMEYEKKKLELSEIKVKLPQCMLDSKRLAAVDKQLRQALVVASNDFSSSGHQKLKELFEKANEAHHALLKAEETESYYIKRRNELELELKKSQINIERAKDMAAHLITSLAYLQTGIEELNSQAPIPKNTALHQLSFFKCIENEKSRIARDLHDGPLQRIASVQMRIDFCKTAIELDLMKGFALLENLKRDLTLTISEVRDILFDLNPAPLEKIGLKACIEHLIHTIFDKQALTIDFSYQIDHLVIDSPIQITIYRIVQELLNNIKKHAQATQLKLHILEMKHSIYIIIEDNGVGFVVPEDFDLLRTQNKSYGLYNIHTRIQQLNGRCKISSQKYKGTTFKVELPLSLT